MSTLEIKKSIHLVRVMTLPHLDVIKRSSVEVIPEKPVEAMI